MNDSKDSGLPPGMADMLAQMAISQATELARAGRYDEAGAILKGLRQINGPAAVTVLDLQARIAAQQGRLTEAERFWIQVAQLDPLHDGARRGLARIARMNRAQPRRLDLALFSLLGIGVAVLLGWWVLRVVTNVQAAWRHDLAAIEGPITDRLQNDHQQLLQLGVMAGNLASNQQAQIHATQSMDQSMKQQADSYQAALSRLATVTSNEVRMAQQESLRRITDLEKTLTDQAQNQHLALLQLIATNSAHLARSERDRSDQIRVLETDLAEQAKTHQEIVRQLQTVKTELAHLVSPPPPPEFVNPLSPLRAALNAPGISALPTNDVLVVCFTEKLFSGGVSLNGHASAPLETVVAALQTSPSDWTITVIGHTAKDERLPGRTYRDGVALSLRRASVVAEFLRSRIQLNPNRLVIKGVGEQSPPFWSSTSADESGRQTITLILSKP
jgi:flagellar motor protein MotB